MRRLAPIIAVALLVAACGGTTAGPGTTAPGTTGAPTTTAAGAATTPPAGGSEGTTLHGNPAGTATVVVGNQRFEFDLDVACLTMFGAIGVAGNAADGSDVDMNADFPPAGWETDTANDWSPPSIRVDDDANDRSWRAGGEFDEVQAVTQITFTSDGHRAYGTATFVDIYANLVGQTPVAGSFEVACPQQ